MNFNDYSKEEKKRAIELGQAARELARGIKNDLAPNKNTCHIVRSALRFSSLYQITYNNDLGRMCEITIMIEYNSNSGQYTIKELHNLPFNDKYIREYYTDKQKQAVLQKNLNNIRAATKHAL